MLGVRAVGGVTEHLRRPACFDGITGIWLCQFAVWISSITWEKVSVTTE